MDLMRFVAPQARNFCFGKSTQNHHPATSPYGCPPIKTISGVRRNSLRSNIGSLNPEIIPMGGDVERGKNSGLSCLSVFEECYYMTS